MKMTISALFRIILTMVIVRVAFVEKVTTVMYAVQATALPPMAVVGRFAVAKAVQTLKVAQIVAAFQK